jgi:hypothetical protein
MHKQEPLSSKPLCVKYNNENYQEIIYLYYRKLSVTLISNRYRSYCLLKKTMIYWFYRQRNTKVKTRQTSKQSSQRKYGELHGPPLKTREKRDRSFYPMVKRNARIERHLGCNNSTNFFFQIIFKKIFSVKY